MDSSENDFSSENDNISASYEYSEQYNVSVEVDDTEDKNVYRKIRSYIEKADFYLSILVKIALLSGALFAIVQWEQAQQEKRIEHTFGYIHSYENGPVLEAREKIRSLLRKYELSYSKNQISLDGAKKLILAFADGDAEVPIADEMDRLIDFYRGLQLCLEQNLCEESVMYKYFGMGVIYYWELFEPYIEQRRNAGNDIFGQDLEDLAKNIGKIN